MCEQSVNARPPAPLLPPEPPPSHPSGPRERPYGKCSSPCDGGQRHPQRQVCPSHRRSHGEARSAANRSVAQEGQSSHPSNENLVARR